LLTPDAYVTHNAAEVSQRPIEVWRAHFLLMSHEAPEAGRVTSHEAGPSGAPYLAVAVQVLPLPGEPVQRQEGVAVAGGAVAETVALPEEAALPDDIATVQRLLQVLLLLEHLGRHGGVKERETWVSQGERETWGSQGERDTGESRRERDTGESRRERDTGESRRERHG